MSQIHRAREIVGDNVWRCMAQVLLASGVRETDDERLHGLRTRHRQMGELCARTKGAYVHARRAYCTIRKQ
jgi:hypothetical protein